MIGEEGDHVGLVAEHVVREAFQRLLGADFDEHAAAVGVERLHALHPLHGGSHLLLEDIFDALDRGRVDVAGDVGDQRQLRFVDFQPVEHLAQRLAGRGDDAGVEGMADRDAHGLHPFLVEEIDGLLDRFACPADHHLIVRIDIGRDDIAIDLL